MLGLGWGTGAMLVLILAQWTTNHNNLYSSALGFSVIFRKTPKYILTIGAGFIGTMMAVGGIYENFIPFLIFLSALIPPIGGIYVGDFLMNRKKYHYENLASAKNLHFVSISIWVLASLVAFMTTPAPNGFGLFTLTGCVWFDAFLVAFVLQLIASKVMQSSNEKLILASQRRKVLMRYIGKEEIENIAIGAALLGTGGGGDPYIGKLMALQAVEEYGPIQSD